MKKSTEYEFCMGHYKSAIVGLSVFLVIVMVWTGYHCKKHPRLGNFKLAAATKPMGPPVRINDKMLHPYWGNCNKCHITVNPGKPISQVMSGPPILIKDKMLHKYWGNCLLCHKVTDGFQAPAGQARKAVAFNQYTARSLGLNLKAVTAATMVGLGLSNEAGLFILGVDPNSIAGKAGLKQSDEIIRIGKARVKTIDAFNLALNTYKPASTIKLTIDRNNNRRNVYLRLKGAVTGSAPQAAPMTQNQIETLAEQLGVPKTSQAVTKALAAQKQGQVVANLNFGKVAIASTGAGVGYQVSPQFGTSLYFIVFDPSTNAHSVVANPNANDSQGQGVQTGQYMVDLHVSSVVAGSFSQAALKTLHGLRVNVYSGLTGSVQNVLNSYLTGGLIPSTAHQTLTGTTPLVANPHPVNTIPGTQGIY